MTDTPGQEPDGHDVEAHVRPRRWFVWVWIVPIAAAAIVVWLSWRSLADRGPEISIEFKAAEGLQAGQTKIQHHDVDVGTVESLELSKDMSRVIVYARMTRRAAPFLNDQTRFYLVAPHVGAAGISGLSTIVSGSYIEMVPGHAGEQQRHFVALDEPPILSPDAQGRSFTLQTPDLGSLTQGSQITYHGVAVGEVEGYILAPNGSHVTVTAFVRAPWDDLVHPETRFWNAGGVDLSFGAQGVRVRANSWQQLLSGGIAFETPTTVLTSPASPAGSDFPLYENRQHALRVSRGPEILYAAEFPGNQRGLEPGTSVELQGEEVGEVKEVHLRYDEHHHTLVTRVAFSVDPDRVSIEDMPHPAGVARREMVGGWLQTLVEHGTRAQVMSASFITGQKLIALDSAPNAPPARIEKVAQSLVFPTTSSGDLSETLASLRGVLQNLDRATSGPQLGHALQELDKTMTHLDEITRDVGPDIKGLVKSLRDTADAAQGTLSSMQSVMGSNGSSPANADLPKLMQELENAARSVRVLADYLDRHPEALLRGRKGDQ